jgi:magnesium chelatase subunit D
LAAGIEAAISLAVSVRRKGHTPTIVLLTDGRANVGRDGEPGRPRAEADALTAARQARAAGLISLFIDTSPRPQEMGQRLAEAMGATYLPLPFADARHVSQAVRRLSDRN